jgi:hypothetical protein
METQQHVMKHAMDKPELTKTIWDLHFDWDQKVKWARNILTETLKNPKFKKGKPVRYGLYDNRQFVKKLGLKWTGKKNLRNI